MSTRYREAALYLLLACLPPAAACAAPPPEPRLAEVIAAAAAGAPARELPAAIAAEGEARQTQADSPFAADPALVLRHQTDRVGAQAGFREWEAGLEAPLWLPGQRGQRRVEGDSYLAEAEATAAAQRLAVAGEVRERLWQVLIARAEMDQAEVALAGAEELQRLVQQRVAAGELARSELLLSRGDTLARRAELAQRSNELEQARAQYRAYTGSDALPVDYLESPPAAGELAEQHGALRQALAAVARARAVRERSRGERRGNPTLYVSAQQGREVAGAGYDGSLNLELRVPLGLSSQAAPLLAGAERGLTEARAEQARLRRELQEELQRAATAYAGLQARLALAEQEHALADQSTRLARRAFELGESDLFKLLATRDQALAARRRLEVGRLELGRAIARYNQAAGVLPE